MKSKTRSRPKDKIDHKSSSSNHPGFVSYSGKFQNFLSQETAILQRGIIKVSSSKQQKREGGRWKTSWRKRATFREGRCGLVLKERWWDDWKERRDRGDPRRWKIDMAFKWRFDFQKERPLRLQWTTLKVANDVGLSRDDVMKNERFVDGWKNDVVEIECAVGFQTNDVLKNDLKTNELVRSSWQSRCHSSC